MPYPVPFFSHWDDSISWGFLRLPSRVSTPTLNPAIPAPRTDLPVSPWHRYLHLGGLEGGSQGSHFSSGPLSLARTLRQSLCPLSTACSLHSSGPGHWNRTVRGTAGPGGQPSLWTQGVSQEPYRLLSLTLLGTVIPGPALLAGSRPVSSWLSHRGGLQGDSLHLNVWLVLFF